MKALFWCQRGRVVFMGRYLSDFHVKEVKRALMQEALEPSCRPGSVAFDIWSDAYDQIKRAWEMALDSRARMRRGVG
jgi:hypothetical protein